MKWEFIRKTPNLFLLWLFLLLLLYSFNRDFVTTTCSHHKNCDPIKGMLILYLNFCFCDIIIDIIFSKQEFVILVFFLWHWRAQCFGAKRPISLPRNIHNLYHWWYIFSAKSSFFVAIFVEFWNLLSYNLYYKY